ncbi:Trefoil factor 1 [Folsomia candida]|uniref:Trefoil factor 1 n=1 Tax=Folsomia candida TaxID=158441 RepID=A0A226EE64_FOLCA|nr:Trefoil factor 1 [Folsomia candida]
MWKRYLYFLLVVNLDKFIEVDALSPPPQDPDWPGWWCSGSYLGEQGVKCLKVLQNTATPEESGPICASQKRSGDLLTPTMLSINSKEDEDLAISAIMWGAYLWEGGSIGVWVSPSSYRDLKLSESSFSSSPLTSNSSSNSPLNAAAVSLGISNYSNSEFRINRNTSSWSSNTRRSSPSSVSGNTCGELRIDVASHGSLGQPSGYGFNPSTISWWPKPCYEKSRVVCATRKLTVTGLLDTITRQKNELDDMRRKMGQIEKDFDTVKDSHCGVDPKERVECGWGGIKQWQCKSRGCCYDNTAGGKFCFKKGEGFKF